MAKNPWMAHMAEVRRKHPNLHFTEVAKKAKETYHPTSKKGGSAMGGDLSPSDFNPDPKLPTSGDAALQLKSTLYSGGKKSRKSKSSKKAHKKSHKKAHTKSKSRSHKRR